MRKASLCARQRYCAPQKQEAEMSAKTLYDKIWDAHVVHTDAQSGESLLYIDLHLIHEVTTPQAFAGLKAAGRKVRRPELTLAVADHNTTPSALLPSRTRK